MLSPENEYYLDNAHVFGHLAGDTYFYLRNIEDQADEVIDGFQHGDDDYPGHMQRMMVMGKHMEAAYQRWRASHLAEARVCAFQTMSDIPDMIRRHVGNWVTRLEETDCRMDQAGIRHLEERYAFGDLLGVLRRGLARAEADLGHLTDNELRQALRTRLEWRDSRPTECCQNIMVNSHQTVVIGGNYVGSGNLPNGILNANNVVTSVQGSAIQFATGGYQLLSARPQGRDGGKALARMWRKRQISERRVVKRSVRLLTKLLGPETVRMYVSGECIRIQGRLAIYELRKTCRLTDGHGGSAALVIYDKEDPETALCQMCIYTPTVPLLDHVASMVMHIQAGVEEDILSIGNASYINDVAYEKEWLKPFLPVQGREHVLNDIIQQLSFVPNTNRLMRSLQKSERQRTAEKIATARLRRKVTSHLYRAVYAPHAEFLAHVRRVCPRVQQSETYDFEEDDDEGAELGTDSNVCNIENVTPTFTLTEGNYVSNLLQNSLC